MLLSKVLDGVGHRMSGAPGDPEVTGICFDSRKVKWGDLFVAVKGQKHDAHDHIRQAVTSGAAAVAAEKAPLLTVPVAVVPSTLEASSRLAANFHGHPSRDLCVVGVTGTNGKTTFTYMMEKILADAGERPGVIGTVEHRWNGKKEPASNTTPLPGDLQGLLAGMKKDGCTHVAMEVSSHALALGRVDDVAFSVGVFTNLTRDHLDFHKDMEGYFKAKAKLFDLLAGSPRTGDRPAVLNVDDEWGAKLSARVRGPRLTYGVKRPADVGALDVILTAQGTAFTLSCPKGRFPFQTPLTGLHNVYNALSAAAAALALGIAPESISGSLAALPGVPGRLERVTAPGAEAPFGVFVDYAHTDDALRNVLEALRPVTKGRLIVAFGCGGDRDRSKRPLMGEVAMRLADFVIVTSDNPRSEDPQKIALDVEVGIRRTNGTHFEVVLDRAEAIERAIGLACPGDVVLLAGKGHETYQIFRDRTIDFDDRVVARGILAKLSKG